MRGRHVTIRIFFKQFESVIQLNYQTGEDIIILMLFIEMKYISLVDLQLVIQMHLQGDQLVRQIQFIEYQIQNELVGKSLFQ